MKTTKYIAISLLFSRYMMLTTACSDDFPGGKDPTGEPLEEYYTTDAHINEALVAAYDPTHWADWGLGQYNALNCDAEVMGDDLKLAVPARPICRDGTNFSISKLTRTIR